jgi:hypothetical protein
MPCRRFLIFERNYFAAADAGDRHRGNHTSQTILEIILYAMMRKIIHGR